VYPLVLAVHSFTRWIVLILGVWLVGRNALGVMKAWPWTSLDERLGSWWTLVLDVQLLLGLLLFTILSPTTARLLQGGNTSLHDPHVAHWTVEHAIPMILAVFIAHGGQMVVRRAEETRRHRFAFAAFGVALVIILVSIPWPFRPFGRPLLRLP